MGTGVLSTGDKILYTMKDMDMGIPGLAALSGVREDTLLEKGFPAERIQKYGFAFSGKQVLIGG